MYYHLEDTGRAHLQQLLKDYYDTAKAIQQVLNYKSANGEQEENNE